MDTTRCWRPKDLTVFKEMLYILEMVTVVFGFLVKYSSLMDSRTCEG